MKKMEMTFVCEELSLDEETLSSWIECELIQPVDVSGPFFDEEDLSRLRFMADMKSLCQANEESLEVMLHLVDQIHILTAELKRLKASKD